MSEFNYAGSEWELFADVRSWKAYWSGQVWPFLRRFQKCCELYERPAWGFYFHRNDEDLSLATPERKIHLAVAASVYAISENAIRGVGGTWRREGERR